MQTEGGEVGAHDDPDERVGSNPNTDSIGKYSYNYLNV